MPLFLVGNEFCQHFAYAKPASLSAFLCCALLRISVGKLSTAKKGGQPLVAGVCFSKLTDKLFSEPFCLYKK